MRYQYYTTIKYIIILFNAFCGGANISLHFEKGVKREIFDTSLEWTTYQKNNDAYKRHPWPKWQQVKVDQLSKFDRE